MSEIKVNSVVNSTGDNDSGFDLSTNDQVIIKTANTTAVTVDSSQGVTLAGKIEVSNGTIKLDGNYPTGTDNVALGNTALDDSSLSGNNNTAIGESSLTANTSGGFNTACGSGALQSNTTASHNVAVGREAGNANVTGENNTFVGRSSGVAVTASSNTFIGRSSGSQITSGSGNTIVGRYQGNSDGLDIRTSNNNIVLSNGDGEVQLAIHADGNVSMGDQKTRFTSSATLNVDQLGSGFPLLCHRDGTGDGVQISFRNDNGQVGRINTSGSATSYVTSSDYRLKENITYDFDATSRLKQLKPCRFNFIADEDKTLVDGFLAHEVSDIVSEAITGEKDAVDTDGQIDPQGIDQSKLVPLLVKTIQELEARITALEKA